MLQRMRQLVGNSPGNLKELGHRARKWQWQLDREVDGLLRQVGWHRSGQRLLFFLVQVGLPALAALLVLVYGIAGAGSVNFLWLFGAVGVAFLIPKRVLVAAVVKRKKRIAAEVTTMIPLLRMLFEVGMTVEQALRILLGDGGKILPELQQELKMVLLRVDAGLDLAEELRSMAQQLDVDELSECMTILEQLIRQGGGAMDSLLALKTLLMERRMTALQETVSKMSAKMSAVMVAFMFPALMIILGGPGFLALFRALGEM